MRWTWSVAGPFVAGMLVAGALAWSQHLPSARAADPSGGSWRFAVAPTKTSYQAARINTMTGATWVVTGTQLTAVSDPTPVPAGSYDLSYEVSGDDTYSLLRGDSVTGAMWWYSAKDQKWNAFTDKKP